MKCQKPDQQSWRGIINHLCPPSPAKILKVLTLDTSWRNAVRAVYTTQWSQKVRKHEVILVIHHPLLILLVIHRPLLGCEVIWKWVCSFASQGSFLCRRALAGHRRVIRNIVLNVLSSPVARIGSYCLFLLRKPSWHIKQCGAVYLQGTQKSAVISQDDLDIFINPPFHHQSTTVLFGSNFACHTCSCSGSSKVQVQAAEGDSLAQTSKAAGTNQQPSWTNSHYVWIKQEWIYNSRCLWSESMLFFFIHKQEYPV